MRADWDANVVLDWMRAHPSVDGHELGGLAERFGVDRARLRDRLRRLVDAGSLTLSAPIAGLADNNPSYTLAATGPPSGRPTPFEIDLDRDRMADLKVSQ